jgi:hypothetical protein
VADMSISKEECEQERRQDGDAMVDVAGKVPRRKRWSPLSKIFWRSGHVMTSRDSLDTILRCLWVLT